MTPANPQGPQCSPPALFCCNPGSRGPQGVQLAGVEALPLSFFSLFLSFFTSLLPSASSKGPHCPSSDHLSVVRSLLPVLSAISKSPSGSKRLAWTYFAACDYDPYPSSLIERYSILRWGLAVFPPLFPHRKLFEAELADRKQKP